MVDFPTLAILAGIPIVLIVGFVATWGNKWLTALAIIFSSFLLFALGFLFDAGHNSQQVFLALTLLTGAISAPMVLIFMIMTLWGFIKTITHGTRG